MKFVLISPLIMLLLLANTSSTDLLNCQNLWSDPSCNGKTYEDRGCQLGKKMTLNFGETYICIEKILEMVAGKCFMYNSCDFDGCETSGNAIEIRNNGWYYCYEPRCSPMLLTQIPLDQVKSKEGPFARYDCAEPSCYPSKNGTNYNLIWKKREGEGHNWDCVSNTSFPCKSLSRPSDQYMCSPEEKTCEDKYLLPCQDCGEKCVEEYSGWCCANPMPWWKNSELITAVIILLIIVFILAFSLLWSSYQKKELEKALLSGNDSILIQ